MKIESISQTPNFTALKVSNLTAKQQKIYSQVEPLFSVMTGAYKRGKYDLYIEGNQPSAFMTNKGSESMSVMQIRQKNKVIGTTNVKNSAQDWLNGFRNLMGISKYNLEWRYLVKKFVRDTSV